MQTSKTVWKLKERLKSLKLQLKELKASKDLLQRSFERETASASTCSLERESRTKTQYAGLSAAMVLERQSTNLRSAREDADDERVII